MGRASIRDYPKVAASRSCMHEFVPHFHHIGRIVSHRTLQLVSLSHLAVAGKESSMKQLEARGFPAVFTVHLNAHHCFISDRHANDRPIGYIRPSVHTVTVFSLKREKLVVSLPRRLYPAACFHLWTANEVHSLVPTSPPIP